MALTERQKQIKGLQTEGLKPPEIAERLGVSPNAIYQQLSRMRSGTATKKATTKKTTSKPAGKPAAPRAPRPAPQAAPVQVRSLTPLQAIRERRSEIERAVKDAEGELSTAEKALEKAREAHTTIVARFEEELAHLTGAEAVLKGEMIARSAPTQKPKNAGKAKDSNGSAPAAPPAAAADAAPDPAPDATEDSETDVRLTQAEREASQSDFDRAVPPPAAEEVPAEAAQATA